MTQEIIEKIENKETTVAVLGLGHIGLPLATMIANSGFHVVGYDINANHVETINEGKLSTAEPDLERIVIQVIEGNNLEFSTDLEFTLKKAEINIVCVPTTITKEKTPGLSAITSCCKDLACYLRRNRLVIIESTLPPRATRSNLAPILEVGSGLKCGEDFWLSYCPERLLTGNALKEIIENDRIIGGYDICSAEITAEFFEEFVEGEIFITDSTTAEVAKLAENTFRDVNIAFANQLALLCETMGVDVLEIIKLANTHSRVEIHDSGPGVGGSCLPKDPYFLLHNSKETNNSLIEIARKINDDMPKHIIRKVLRALRKLDKDIEDSRITVLGTAYKGNSDNADFSPSKYIVNGLKRLGALVSVHDPYCREGLGALRKDTLLDAVKDADCLVIMSDHLEYADLDLKKIKNYMNHDPAIVDGKRLINPKRAKDTGFIYRGLGC